MIFLDLKNEFDLLMQKRLRPQAALLQMLHKINENNELLDEQKIAVLSELCQVSPAVVNELSRELLTSRQSSEFNLICMDLPCYINGADEIYEKQRGIILKSEQSIEKFQPSRCLGHCYSAPVAVLSDGMLCQIGKTPE